MSFEGSSLVVASRASAMTELRIDMIGIDTQINALSRRYVVMKSQAKPKYVTYTTKLIEWEMEKRDQTLKQSIRSLEMAWPFYDQYDVLCQLINYRLYRAAFAFALTRHFVRKGRISIINWKHFRDRLSSYPA